MEQATKKIIVHQIRLSKISIRVWVHHPIPLFKCIQEKSESRREWPSNTWDLSDNSSSNFKIMESNHKALYTSGIKCGTGRRHETCVVWGIPVFSAGTESWESLTTAKELPWTGLNSMTCVHLDQELEPNLAQEGRVSKLHFAVLSKSPTIHSAFFLRCYLLHFSWWWC